MMRQTSAVKLKADGVKGKTLTVQFSQYWNNKKGSDYCSLSDDGTKLNCSYLQTLTL